MKEVKEKKKLVFTTEGKKKSLKRGGRQIRVCEKKKKTSVSRNTVLIFFIYFSIGAVLTRSGKYNLEYRLGTINFCFFFLLYEDPSFFLLTEKELCNDKKN